MLAFVLGLAFVAARACANADPDVSQEQAIEIARGVAAFEPDGTQIRFVRQGIPQPIGVWAVSMYQGTAVQPTRYQVVTVNATTGEIIDDGR
jgi:hypothetical protein